MPTSIYLKLLLGALCAPYGPDSSNNCGQESEIVYGKTVFDHPHYDAATFSSDFSLIHLNQQSTITPVSMDQGVLSNTYVGGLYNSLVY